MTATRGLTGLLVIAGILLVNCQVGLSPNIAVAAKPPIPDKNGTFHACYQKGGLIRILFTPPYKCPKGERGFTWDQKSKASSDNTFSITPATVVAVVALLFTILTYVWNRTREQRRDRRQYLLDSGRAARTLQTELDKRRSREVQLVDAEALLTAIAVVTAFDFDRRRWKNDSVDSKLKSLIEKAGIVQSLEYDYVAGKFELQNALIEAMKEASLAAEAYVGETLTVLDGYKLYWLGR